MSAATPLALGVPPALHSAASSKWYTPAEIVDAARDLIGGFVLDPASDAMAQSVVKAAVYYTEADDGLAQDWDGSTFLNPPTPPREWWIKLMRHVRSGSVPRAVYIAYSLEQLSQSQAWGEKAGLPSMVDYPICIPRKRVAYLKPYEGALVRGHQPPHASAIVGINVGRGDFARAFGAMGACL